MLKSDLITIVIQPGGTAVFGVSCPFTGIVSRAATLWLQNAHTSFGFAILHQR